MDIKALIGLTTGVLTGLAGVAEAQYDRDQDRTKQQKQASPTAESEEWGQNPDKWFDEYFGEPREATRGYADLDNLTGVWQMKVTRHIPQRREGMTDASTRSRTSTGVAERRWSLDGTLLVERYTLRGGTENLPLQIHGMTARGGETDAKRHEGRMREAEKTRRDRAARDREDKRQARRSMERDVGNQGIVLWGYNDSKDRFNVVWTDSAHGAIRFDTGELDDEGRLVLTGSYTDRDGGEVDTRSVIHMASSEKQTLTMYEKPEMGDERKALEIVYTRMEMSDEDWSDHLKNMQSNKKNGTSGP